MSRREPSWRVFAEEFTSSSLQIEGKGDKTPSYLLTPLGAKINRLFTVGVLTESKNTGTPQEPMWRARVTDPTGTFFVWAGQYQPEATAELARLEPPVFTAVIGKTSVYRPDEDSFLTSIRAERVKEVTEKQRNGWIVEAAESLQERMELLRDVRGEEVTEEELVSEGYSERTADGVLRAREHYGEVDLSKYRRTLVDALRTVVEGDRKDEELLELIDELEDGCGVGAEKVKRKAQEALDISENEFEDIFRELREQGRVYEPVLGKIGTTGVD